MDINEQTFTIKPIENMLRWAVKNAQPALKGEDLDHEEYRGLV